MRHISRVLQVVAVMNQGGAENMIMNYYRAADTHFPARILRDSLRVHDERHRTR